MGQHHCRIYANLRQTQFVGVYDINPAAADEIAQRYDVAVFKSVDELLDEVDAVSIATPTPTHFDLVKKCLQHNVHVLVEKPITESLAEAEELVTATTGRDLIVQVGFIERFNPAYQELKNVLEDLSVLAINFRRLSPFRGSNRDVDVVLDLMIHDLDLVLSFVKSEIHQIQAIGIPVLTPRIDIANARIEFANGCVANLTASRVSDEKVRKLRFFQPDSYVSLDFLKREADLVSLQPGPGPLGRQIVRNKLTGSAVEPLRAEIVSFLDAVAGCSAVACSGTEGLRALDLALRVMQVMRRQ
jgi:predicted dehydrogenase